jgi:hypothetical protein
MLGIFTEKMAPTFEHIGDAMPATLLSYRRKYIHSVGVTGKVKFLAYENPYTGMFRGADQGLIRLSAAIKPSGDSGTPFTPGMGLKLLRDGKVSANLVSMKGTGGQPNDWNFFSKIFSNKIGPTPKDR